MFGARDQVQAVRHLIGTAGGWGGLPEHEAYYVGVEPNLPVAEYRIDVPAKVPVGAFWSVSLYNARGFFQPNAQGAYNVNSVTGARNGDGSMTIARTWAGVRTRGSTACRSWKAGTIPCVCISPGPRFWMGHGASPRPAF